jgi:SAM-dependent methyltransferase
LTPHRASRRAKLLATIDVAHARGLEIGALDRPTVTRAEGDIRFADHRTAADLRRFYAAEPSVDGARIVEVDVVLDGGPLAAALPPGTRFDYVVASHVIEHVPDVIGWLQQISAVLAPGGRLCLAIPDKRFSFDRLGTISTLGDFVDAHLTRRTAPSIKQVYDYSRSAATVNAARAWLGLLDARRLVRSTTATGALQACRQLEAGARLDVHCFVFTPRSFLALFDELVTHGWTDFRIARFWDTQPLELEFFVVLEKLAAPDPPAQRASIPALPARVPLRRWIGPLLAAAARRLRR